MKIQYASDLHLEFDVNERFLLANPLIPEGDILVLAGDIGYLNNYAAYPFWDWASERFKEVYVIPGNHEFYLYNDLACLPFGEICRIRNNVRCYYNAVISIDGVDIILSTLWSRILPQDELVTEHSVSDFRRIKYDGHLLTWKSFNEEHERCFHFLMKSIEESKADKIVVATHHVPSFLLESTDFNGSRINGAFIVELSNFILSSPIDYWIYGHSHRNINKIIGNTKCVTNQLGYVELDEHKDFRADACIEV